MPSSDASTEKGQQLDNAHPGSPSSAPPARPPDQQTTTPEPPPNGGYGWVVMACASLINGHTWGINSSYGVFLNHYLSSNVFPGATRLDYAFVGGISIGVALLIAPLATITTRSFGTRTTLLVGTLLEFAALLSASFASRIWHLYLSQGLCFALGMGFLFVGSVGLVPQWFTTRRSLANGIAAAGSGIGGLVYSLATQAMINSIGLSWAFRVLAVLAVVVNGTCSLVIRDRNKIIGSSQNAFDASLLKRLEYLLLLAFGFLSMLGYVVLLFSLANYGHSIGLTAQRASLVSALFNLGQGLGRPPIGYFSDKVGRINMAFAATLFCGILAFVLWIFAKSFGVLVFYALIGGTVAGTFWAVIAPVTTEIVGLKHVPSALNLLWVFIAPPLITSEPIGLQIVAFDGGSYRGAQIFVGCMYIGAAGCMLLIRGWKIGEVNAFADMKHEANNGVEPIKMENADGEMLQRCRTQGRKRIFVDMLKPRRV